MSFEEITILCNNKDLFERVINYNLFSQEEAAQISAAYLQIFKRNIKKSCSNCVGDALAELRAFYFRDPEQMQKQNACRYSLRAGILIRLSCEDSAYYSNANLTDEIAEAYILAAPSRLSEFSRYPESIRKQIDLVECTR